MTTLVVLFVGLGLLFSLVSVTFLAANEVEIPDALKTYIVGAVGMLGGILVPTVNKPETVVEGGSAGLG